MKDQPLQNRPPGRRTHIFGHRGNSSAAPENTLAAFRALRDCGADGVEFDVMLSADGEPVVIHDDTLERTTNGRGLVPGHTWSALRALDAGAWFGEAFRGEGIPHLEAVLDLLAPTDLVVNIELKGVVGVPQPTLAGTVAAAVRNAGLEARVVCSSFHHPYLLDMAREAPALERAALLEETLLEPWDYVIRHGFQALHPNHHSVSEDWVASCHAHGVAIRAYTVDDEKRAAQLMDWGMDAIITNHPQRLARLAGRQHRG